MVQCSCFLAQNIFKTNIVVGDGNQTRDFTYVTDVVDVMIKASRSKQKIEYIMLVQENNLS